MKICLLGENGSTHIQKWIKAISSQKQINLHVISFNRGAKFSGVSYHPLKKITGKKIDYLLNAFKVKSLIHKINPDIVHAHYATSYGFLASFSGFHPLIITGWGSDIFDSPKNYFMRKLLKNSFRKCDVVTVLSKFTREEIKKLTDKNVELIPFGIDTSVFLPWKDYSIGTIKIGTVRTLSEKYGVEYLIRAFGIICKTNNNVQLEIVGDGPLRSFLENLAETLGIRHKVIFHGYINQNTETEKYISILSSFDIFSILSIMDSETFGVAALEASACGIPVVATSVGGLPEVIEDEKTGIIVPPRNTEATARAIERLIENQELRKKMGENGRKKVEEHYDWKNNVSRMIELYIKLVK